MDTIQDTPHETFGGKLRRRWNAGANGTDVAITTATGRPYSSEANWRVIAMVGAGVAAGALLGAGMALLMAPQSGAHTRLALRSEIRRRRPWRASPWDQLGEELRRAAHRKNRRRAAAEADSDD